MLDSLQLILETVSETPTTANNLRRIINEANPKRKISTVTVQRYLDLIDFIQQHPVKIRLMRMKVGQRTFRAVEKVNHP